MTAARVTWRKAIADAQEIVAIWNARQSGGRACGSIRRSAPPSCRAALADCPTSSDSRDRRFCSGPHINSPGDVNKLIRWQRTEMLADSILPGLVRNTDKSVTVASKRVESNEISGSVTSVAIQASRF